jgi:hypothetical protein
VLRAEECAKQVGSNTQASSKACQNPFRHTDYYYYYILEFFPIESFAHDSGRTLVRAE